MSQFFNGLLTLAMQAPSDEAAAVVDAAKTTTSEIVEAPSKAEPIPVQPSGASDLAFFVTAMSVLVLPFVAAWFIAKALKVQEWTGRLSVVMFTLAIGAAPFLTSLMNGQPILDRFRLGIDLAGGTNMVFQVKSEGKPLTNEIMSRMVDAVSQRINKSGTEEVTVRQVGSDRIEVIVPGEDPQSVDEIKRSITRLGSLEFFICADSSDQQIIRDANQLDVGITELIDEDEIEIDEETKEVINDGLIAKWVPAYEKNGVPKFLGPEAISRKVEKIRTVDGKSEKYQTEEYLMLVVPKEERVTGKYLRNASTDFDSNGQIIVSFMFDQTGGYYFGQLTGRNLPKPGREPRKLAIVLDGRVFSAPGINSQITTRGQIEGGGTGFERAEAEELTAVLNAGALEVPIDPKPLSEATVDPTLGADVRVKGVNATLISGFAVIIFMLVYYRFSGTVAVVSLILNILLTVGAMVAINATFTLPGIAGIVLTIGMAVDANVLIYERMREEVAKGSSVRMAIQNGFEKAFITIFDANITTLLTAVILFAIGTDQIKGFAVTLFLGLAISMYTVLFVGRLMFDIAEKKRWIKSLNMMQAIGETKFDFLKHRATWCGISLVIIGIGMIAFFIRGQKNYDIDFTGGTMVSFQTTEPKKTVEVTEALKAEFKDEFSLERLTVGAETEEGIGTYFRLRCTETDTHGKGGDKDAEESPKETKSSEERVRERVFTAFKDNDSIKLRMVSLGFSDVAPFTIAEGDNSAEAALRSRYNGGSMSDLTFSEEVAIGTVGDMLTEALGQVKKDSSGNVAEAFGLEGTEGSGLTAAERAVKKYSKLTVRVVPSVNADELKASLASIQTTLSSSPLFDEVNTFASAVADEMRDRAVIAIVVSILAISAYIWFRFQSIVFGVAAVVALIHDVLVSLGFVAMASWVSGTPIGDLLLIDDFRINLPMIAAFLTLVGYSLNDTIVTFDRIREIRGKNPAITVQMVNLAMNQTLGRTLLTATTVFIVVFILYAFGGAGIHGFAWCLLIGCIAGTYSSIYIASPILVWAFNRTQAGAIKA